MNITKKAEALLRATFTHNGRPLGSAVQTSQGTLPHWCELVLAGYVAKDAPSPLGHPFSYKLTDEGRAFLSVGVRFCGNCRKFRATTPPTLNEACGRGLPGSCAEHGFGCMPTWFRCAGEDYEPTEAKP